VAATLDTLPRMIWSTVSDISAVVTIVGVPYLVASYRRRTPRLSFSFSGSAREAFDDQDGRAYCRFIFQGSVRNASLDPNSIEKIYLLVWKSRRKKGVRTYGSYSPTVTEGGSELPLPIRLDARQGRTLRVVFEVALDGHVVELVNAVQPLSPAIPGTPPGAQLYLPKYTFELAFEDIAGNFFDQDGTLRNRRGIDRRWTLENTFRHLKDGNPLPFLKHITWIGMGDAVFFVKRNVRRLGI